VLIATGAPIVGNVVSVTVTNCVAVTVLPDPSTTVHVTVVFPNGNATGASLVTLAIEQLSLVTGLPKTTPVAVHPVLVVVLIARGATIVGKELSTTVTTCVAVDVLPDPSTTVHVTVVFPNGNELGALFVTLATEQLSLVTGVPKFVFTAKHPLLVDIVSAAGAVIAGVIISVTVTF
jgi:hypothetical protein